MLLPTLIEDSLMNTTEYAPSLFAQKDAQRFKLKTGVFYPLHYRKYAAKNLLSEFGW